VGDWQPWHPPVVVCFLAPVQVKEGEEVNSATQDYLFPMQGAEECSMGAEECLQERSAGEVGTMPLQALPRIAPSLSGHASPKCQAFLRWRRLNCQQAAPEIPFGGVAGNHFPLPSKPATKSMAAEPRKPAATENRLVAKMTSSPPLPEASR
jgi:hypothetical protein